MQYDYAILQAILVWFLRFVWFGELWSPWHSFQEDGNCLPKGKDGLGLKKSKDTNRALLVKLAWMFASKEIVYARPYWGLNIKFGKIDSAKTHPNQPLQYGKLSRVSKISLLRVLVTLSDTELLAIVISEKYNSSSYDCVMLGYFPSTKKKRKKVEIGLIWIPRINFSLHRTENSIKV